MYAFYWAWCLGGWNPGASGQSLLGAWCTLTLDKTRWYNCVSLYARECLTVQSSPGAQRSVDKKALAKKAQKKDTNVKGKTKSWWSIHLRQKMHRGSWTGPRKSSALIQQLHNPLCTKAIGIIHCLFPSVRSQCVSSTVKWWWSCCLHCSTTLHRWNFGRSRGVVPGRIFPAKEWIGIEYLNFFVCYVLLYSFHAIPAEAHS